MRLGIDLGGTNIAAGLVDRNMNIVVRGSVKTPKSAEDIAGNMEALALSLCAEAGISASGLKSAGIGSPGAIDTSEGIVIYSNNLNFHNVPLAGMLAKKLGRPVRIGNDANVAALGEKCAGAGRDYDSMIMVTLGTGVGGGVIIDGKIFDGFNGMAGEVGHMVTVQGGRLCTCGRKGCWEAYASATGLIALTKEAIERNPDSLLKRTADGQGKINGRTAFLAARAGCPAGDGVVESYMTYVACGAANLINLFQPAMLCFGGGISGEGQYLIDRLRPLLEPELYDVGDKKTELALARLGNDAGIIGAAML